MTNPQTEARAIAEAARKLVRNTIDAIAVEELVLDRTATALVSKDAELAARRKAAEHLLERAQTAEAQLAEANKALEPFAAIADAEDEAGRDDPDDDRVWIVQAHGCQIGDLTVEHFRAARCALEAALRGEAS